MTVFSADKFSSGDIAARAEYFEKGEGILLEDGQEPERSTGGEDYYHRPGADTLLTEYLGQGAQLMELGINPQDGDYAALMSGTNPRTGKSYVTERRQGELQRGTGLAGYSTSFNIDKTLSLVYAPPSTSPTASRKCFSASSPNPGKSPTPCRQMTCASIRASSACWRRWPPLSPSASSKWSKTCPTQSRSRPSSRVAG